MKLIVHGQQAFGKSVLEALLERGEEVLGVYCEPDKEGRPAETAEQMASLGADLCVMAYVTLFVPEEVLNIPTHDSIQYHPSLLPLHRGGSSINWHLPTQTTWNLIRGCNPQPGAWTTFEDGKMFIFDARKLAEATSVQPGQVVKLSEAGIQVATSQGQILIERLRPEKGKKVAAAEWAGEVGLKPGALCVARVATCPFRGPC